jgi:hypothetical protein
MKELKQSRIFSKREFKILRNSVSVKMKTWTEYFEYEVPLDDLGLKILKKRDKGPKLVFILFSTLTFSMGYFSLVNYIQGEELHKVIAINGLGLICLLFSIAAFLGMQNTLVYIFGGEKTIELFDNSPSEESVQAFIETIFQIKKEKIKSNILAMQHQVPEEVFKQQLEWMIDNDIIDQNEFDNLLEKHKVKRIVGFNPNE